MNSEKILVTLSDGSKKKVTRFDIAIGNFFNTPEGEKIIAKWMMDDILKVAESNNTLWEQQGIRKFICSCRACVELVKNIRGDSKGNE